MRSLWRCLRFLALAPALLLAPHGWAITDLDGDGYDDVWQRQFGVTVAELPLTEDADGDGFTNQAEMFAGTDPRDPADNPRVKVVSRPDSATASLSVQTVYGTRYQLQSGPTPAGPWVDLGSPITGDGTLRNLTTSLANPPGTRFFLVKTTDQDSDGDGVSDWAENQLGTNPLLASSPGNASGGVATDGDTLKSLLSVTATVVASDALAKEGTPAKVRLTRTWGTMPLKVNFALAGNLDPKKGSATSSDYTLSGATSTSASFTANSMTQDVVIAPVTSATPKVPRTLRFLFKPLGVTSTTSPLAEVTVRDAAVVAGNRRLYVAYLGRETGITSTATGLATALVEGDNSSATINLTFSNLSSVQNTAYIKIDPGLPVFRINNGQVNGQAWPILAAQFLTTDQAALDALRNGSLYVSVSSADNPDGEIRGNFQPATGSVDPPPIPPDPPTYGTTDFPNVADSAHLSDLDRDISRFLMQATFGPTPESIQEVRDLISANGSDAIAGYTAWINKQMDLAQTPSPSLQALVIAADLEEFMLRGNKPSTYSNDPQFGGASYSFNSTTRVFDVVSSLYANNHPFENNRRREWWTLVLNSQDQLRQRMAQALSEIVVISDNDTTVQNFHYGAANYWDMLAANAFGTYRNILERVTYSPMMGQYLSHLKNQKRTGSISPDENYAREIMQLFSIGLIQRHPDGTLKLDATSGLPIPTYDQADITEMARVMTGLSFSKKNGSSGSYGTISDNTSFTQGSGNRYFQASWTNELKMFPTYHDFNEYTAYTGNALPSGVTSASKILFNGKTGITPLPLYAAAQQQTEANANADIATALNTLGSHPNISVFISRLLIQRLTSSNPSAGYLYRVSKKYRDTGGNLGEVLKAILLDYEVRSVQIANNKDTTGRPKEPLIHLAAVQRALKFKSQAPLANLNKTTSTFGVNEAPGNLPYAASEYAKFPAGTTRFRWPDTEASVTQNTLSAPSVFNWFLPDYVVPGPLGNAGLYAPEMQVVTESSVVRITNALYSILTPSLPPGTLTKYGYGLDNFFNLSNYSPTVASTGQLSVPALGRPYDATSNPTGLGYFSAPKFDASAAPVKDTADTINNQLDNVVPAFTDLTTPNTLTKLYYDSYNASLISQAGSLPTSPTPAQIAIAHDAAALAVLDRCDLLFTAGFLKAAFGSAGGTNPRQSIINALNSGVIGNRTYHTDRISQGFLTNAQVRVRNIAYLVATSPQAIVLK